MYSTQCSKHGSGDGNAPPSPPGPGGIQDATLNPKIGVGIDSVTGFAIIPASSAALNLDGTGGQTSVNTLYSINKDGSLTVVTVTNSPCEAGASTGTASDTSTTPSTGTGTETTCTFTNTSIVHPLALFNTKLYVLIPYLNVSCAGDQSSAGNGPEGTVVALEKATGNLYCMPNTTTLVARVQGDGGSDLAAYFKPVQTDDSGRIIWFSPLTGAGGDIFRADFTDPASPKVTTISNSTSIQPGQGGFAVNAEGDAFFGFGNMGGSGAGTPAVVQLAGGGFDNVSIYGTSCVNASNSPSNPDDFYYIDSATSTSTGIGGQSGPVTSNYLEVAPKSGNFTPTHAVQVPPSLQSNIWNCGAGMVQIGTHTFMSNQGGNMGGNTASFANAFLDVVEGASPAATTVNVTALTSISRIAGGGDYLYILGQDTSGNALIVSYGPVSGKATQKMIVSPTLTSPDKYTVLPQNFSVASAGDVTFQGSSSSDGATILVTIPAGETFQASDVTNKTLPQVSQLVRIN
jgi:hypothetical protein